MSFEVLIPILVLVAIFGSLFSMTVAAALWERRPIQPYYIPNEGQEYEPSELALRANAQAAERGFRHDCLCHDGKGKLYRVRYDFWISEDDLTFVVIGSGTVAGMPVNGTWLYSRSVDGRTLCTTNEIGEQDISGVEDQATWPRTNFDGLYARHSRRLRSIAARPFEGDSTLYEYFELRKAKADGLVQRGYAYYVKDEKLVWKYTLRGAIVFYLTSVWLRPLARFLRLVRLSRP